MWAAKDPHMICGCTDQCWVAQRWECESLLTSQPLKFSSSVYSSNGWSNNLTLPIGKTLLKRKTSICVQILTLLLTVRLEQVNQLLWICFFIFSILMKKYLNKNSTHSASPSTYLCTQFMLISFFKSFNKYFSENLLCATQKEKTD